MIGTCDSDILPRFPEQILADLAHLIAGAQHSLLSCCGPYNSEILSSCSKQITCPPLLILPSYNPTKQHPAPDTNLLPGRPLVPRLLPICFTLATKITAHSLKFLIDPYPPFFFLTDSI